MGSNKTGQEGTKKNGEDNEHPEGTAVNKTNIPIGSSTEKDPRRVLFGTILRKIRKVRGKNIYELAREAQVDAGYISRLENAHRNPPSPKIMQRFADALDIRVDFLMIAAGYLEYDSTGEKYSSEGIIKLVERELFGDGEPPQSIDLEPINDGIDEKYSIIPLIQDEALCMGVTDDGTSVIGKAMLIIANTEQGPVHVSEITHLLE
ncbi:helix-turn-helix domain-containing protein [Patescibacteria group bacterium]